MTCQYCANEIQVPEEFWREEETKKVTTQWTKWIVIFLVLTVGLPTCLGLFGTLLGIFGAILGIFAPIIAMIITFLVKLFVH